MHRVAVGSGHARYFSEQTYTNQIRLTNAPSGIQQTSIFPQKRLRIRTCDYHWADRVKRDHLCRFLLPAKAVN